MADNVCPQCYTGALINPNRYYCDWNNTYYTLHQDCISASTMIIHGKDVVCSKHEVVMLGGIFGILFTVLLVWAWFKAIL